MATAADRCAKARARDAQRHRPLTSGGPAISPRKAKKLAEESGNTRALRRQEKLERLAENY